MVEGAVGVARVVRVEEGVEEAAVVGWAVGAWGRVVRVEGGGAGAAMAAVAEEGGAAAVTEEGAEEGGAAAEN